MPNRKSKRLTNDFHGRPIGELMLQSLANEVQITKRVLSAIPSAKQDLSSGPRMRGTAWEPGVAPLQNTDVSTFSMGLAETASFKMESPTEEKQGRGALAAAGLNGTTENIVACHPAGSGHDSGAAERRPVEFFPAWFNFPRGDVFGVFF